MPPYLRPQARQKFLNIDLMAAESHTINRKLYQSHHQVFLQLPASGSDQLPPPQKPELTEAKALIHQRFKICQTLLNTSMMESVYL
jgi:hypothetical protein